MKPAASENRGGQRPIGSELRAAAAPKKSLPTGSHGPGGDVVRPNKTTPLASEIARKGKLRRARSCTRGVWIDRFGRRHTGRGSQVPAAVPQQLLELRELRPVPPALLSGSSIGLNTRRAKRQ